VKGWLLGEIKDYLKSENVKRDWSSWSEKFRLLHELNTMK